LKLYFLFKVFWRVAMGDIHSWLHAVSRSNKQWRHALCVVWRPSRSARK